MRVAIHLPQKALDSSADLCPYVFRKRGRSSTPCEPKGENDVDGRPTQEDLDTTRDTLCWLADHWRKTEREAVNAIATLDQAQNYIPPTVEDMGD